MVTAEMALEAVSIAALNSIELIRSRREIIGHSNGGRCSAGDDQTAATINNIERSWAAVMFGDNTAWRPPVGGRGSPAYAVCDSLRGRRRKRNDDYGNHDRKRKWYIGESQKPLEGMSIASRQRHPHRKCSKMMPRRRRAPVTTYDINNEIALHFS